MSTRGILSGRYDAAVIGLLVRLIDGLAAGKPPSAVLGALPLPPADMAMADRLARATAAELAALQRRWADWDETEKRAYAAAVLASWKARRGGERGGEGA